MNSIILAIGAALGAYLLLPGSPDAAPGVSERSRSLLAWMRTKVQSWLTRSGLHDTTPERFVLLSMLTGSAAGCLTWFVLEAPVPAVAVGLACATLPATLLRRRAARSMDAALDWWPRMIDEVRVRVGSAGQPIPQAFWAAGMEGPEAYRPAFAAARREWALSIDFASSLAVLKEMLADPTADVVCETVLVIHEVGGDLDPVLEALGVDRRTDLRHRREAESRSAGARLARWFVLLVPAGMAFAGLNLGEGRDAYDSPAAQLATTIAVIMVAACWWWAARIMRVPAQRRVFDR